MSGLFGSKAQQPTATQPVAVQGVNLQTSVLGKAIPIVYGTTRIAGNLMLYGNFLATAVYSQSGGGGGKGGHSNSGSATISGYNYYADFAFALCEGPISNVGRVWLDKSIYSLATIGFTLFTGTYPQIAWGTTVSWSYTNENGVPSTGVSTALGYNGISYVATASAHFLGQSAILPNHNYEVYGILSTSVTGKNDADPSLVIVDMLTNVHYGAGFPSALIGDLSTAPNSLQNYTLASGLLISPAYTSQTAVSSMLEDICLACNSEAVWSSGLLTFVPRGDQALTGNGKTYTPPTVPLFDLTDDDFMANPKGSGGGDNVGPIVVVRKRPSDKLNSVKLEFLDRSNNYNPAVCYANDQALIDRYGLRTNGSKEVHMFCDATAANLCANLQLRREQICNMYYFDLDQRYIVLDPMDIVTITDSTLGLSNQWVRIVEITENDDGSLSFVAEEYLAGIAHAPAYSFAQASGFLQNRNVTPGPLNAPILFEPPYALAGALEVWCAISEPVTGNFGGADVYVSSDSVTYSLAGRINGSSRTGVLSATLPTVTPALSGVTVDQTNTLSVDLTQSGGELQTSTTQQADNLASLCYVDGEFIAYANATLTATNKYNLTYLVRGGYNSAISAHAAASSFVRCDGSLFKLAYTEDRIGQTIYIKFLPFNQYGGGQPNLSAVTPYAYTIQGAALAAPLADVSNVSAGYIGNISSIDWSEISDFRAVLYEIRKGEAWDSAQFISRQAHPPFKTFGNGTYWVAAFTQPLESLTVYSPNPQSIVVNESNVTYNIIATRVQNPTWPGAVAGDAIKIGATIQTNGVNGGTYTISSTDRISLTAVKACAVLIDWGSNASPLNNSVFTYNGPATLTIASSSVSGLQIYGGTGALHGNALIDGLATTLDMGPGEPITGTGIPDGAEVLSVLSTSSILMTVAATTGSTSAGSTQTVNVFPNLHIGQIIESTNIPAGAMITAVSTSLSSITMSTTALASSTGDVSISIDWINTADFFGSNGAAFANIYPEIRMSTSGGSTWGDWQRYVSGYYFGDAFDARMQIATLDVNYIGVLNAFTFSVDVPDRWDHYNSVAVSSLGTALTFRPDGGSTAPFNGGPQGTTVSQPSLIGAIIAGSPGDSLAFSSISLSGATVSCFTSTGGAAARSTNIIAKGY